jgi:hypothetical protein
MIDRALAYGLNGGSQPVPSTKTVEKIVSPLIPCNPLISLDSVERIQRKSKENQ